jgi:hypothetical protein
MFYRQKVLLALIEALGDKVPHTDLEKHLFLFCQVTEKNHYDFFPYRFGPFSFTSYDDKRKLVENRLLKDTDSFHLASTNSYLNKLQPDDAHKMRLYIRQQGTLKGKNLVRKIYMAYPQYTIRSEIAEEIFTVDEYKTIKEQWGSETDKVLLSLGYEGITIDEYIAKLIFNNVSLLVDVRQNPYSHKHGFTKKQLEKYVLRTGIKYVHLPELGIPSNLRKDLDTPNDYELLFEHYGTHILPQQNKAVTKILEWVLQGERVAITCFEAIYSMCHRHKITEAIAKNPRTNFPVVHL